MINTFKVVQWFLMIIGLITVVMFFVGLITTAYHSKPIDSITEDDLE